MQKRDYAVSGSGIVTGLSLLADIFGVADGMAKLSAWVSVLLPVVGIAVALVGAIWFTLTLVEDVASFIQKKRRAWSELARRVADDVQYATELNRKTEPRDHEFLSAATAAMAQLREKELWPKLPTTPDGKRCGDIDRVAEVLYRVASIIDSKGVREARRQVAKINREWRNNPDPEAMKSKVKSLA